LATTALAVIWLQKQPGEAEGDLFAKGQSGNAASPNRRFHEPSHMGCRSLPGITTGVLVFFLTHGVHQPLAQPADSLPRPRPIAPIFRDKTLSQGKQGTI
jgi:hypothetical protein